MLIFTLVKAGAIWYEYTSATGELRYLTENQPENQLRSLLSGVFRGTPLHLGSPLAGYIAGPLLVLLGGVGRLEMMKSGDNRGPFLLFYPAIALAAFLGGAGPGFLAILASAVFVAFQFPFRPDPANSVLFTLSGPLLVVLCVHLRKVRDTGYATARENARFRLISDNAGDWLFLLGESGAITYTNATATRHLGFTPSELIRKTLQDLTVESDRDALNDMLRRCRSAGAATAEVTFTARDGTQVAVEAGGTAVRVADELVVHVAARDITSRKQMESRLREAQRWESLGVMAGGLAHDFNNLLTTVLGNASLAREYLDAGHPATESLHSIEHAGESAAELIRLMLATAGYRSRAVRKADLPDVLNQTLASRIFPAEVRIVSNVDAPPFPGDPRSLSTLLGSLISNAVESYDSRPGEVHVRISSADTPDSGPASVEAGFETGFEEGEHVESPCLTIVVEDSGSGMTPEVLARAFDPFYTTKFTGRGLGLPAVRGLVRSYGGRIRLETEAGRGTRVEIRLPGYLPSSTSSALARSS